MLPPRYNFAALNALSLGDTGRFVFLEGWGLSALTSILAQEAALEFWANDQYPLSQVERDDLENKLATTLGALMRSQTGLIFPICTAAIPQGTLICDGAAYTRADYPILYAALDAAYIIDANNFRVPDMRDKFALGAGPLHAAASTGGASSVTQSIAQMPTHSHSSAPHSHSEAAAAPTAILIGAGVPAPSAIPAIGVTGLTSVSISNEGGGGAMDIMPPYTALIWVVVAV